MGKVTGFAVVIAAGGRSIRFGKNKLLQMLAGQTVIARAVSVFLSREDVAQIVIAAADPTLIQQSLLASGSIDGRVRVISGGATRAQSVRNAMEVIDPAIEWVAVHDAARPLVSSELIDQTLAAAVAHGAAAPALPVHLTIKEAPGPLPARVQKTVPRLGLWAMQTPQIIRRRDFEKAYRDCPIPLDEVTDDVQLIELAGGEVWLINGEERNIKITTSIDLKLAEMILDDNRHE